MRNIEALRNYFLGKDPQLKETMSDNSLRLIGIPGRFFVQREELIERLKKIQEGVSEEDEKLQKEIDDLIEDLAQEVTNRGNADQAIRDDYLSKAQATTDYYTKPQVDGKITFKHLTGNVTIPTNGVPDLETGWYNTGEYGVYYGDTVDPFTSQNELFYYESNPLGPHFEFLPGGIDVEDPLRAFAWFDVDEHEWHFDGFWVTHTISDSSTDNEIPTAASVYEALQHAGGGIPELTVNPINVWETDPGLYQVPQGTDIYITNDALSPITYTVANQKAYLYLGRVNDYTNIMLLDKTGKEGFNGSYDLSSAIYFGWSKQTSPTVVAGSFAEMSSLLMKYEEDKNKVGAIDGTNYLNYTLYPSVRAVTDYVASKVNPVPGDATRFTPIEWFSIANSTTDTNGNVTYQELLRADNSLAITRQCSNPDAYGNYQTIVETFYKADGATINYTDTYAYTFSSTGAITSKTMTTTEV